MNPKVGTVHHLRFVEPLACGRSLVCAEAFMVGLVWVVLDERGQALHDRLAATFVVNA